MVSSYKVVSPSLAYRTFAATPRFAKLAYSHAVLLYPHIAGHGQRGLSVPLRWWPAHGLRSAVRLWSRSERLAAWPGHITRARPLASSMQVWPFGLRFAAFHPASSLATFEATIEHARTVLHQSLCFVYAAHLPVVGFARSARILARLVIQARARRFSAAA